MEIKDISKKKCKCGNEIKKGSSCEYCKSIRANKVKVVTTAIACVVGIGVGVVGIGVKKIL